jgi:preprotein translocase subunit SecA
MFSAMLEGIKEETVSYLFNAQVQPAEPAAVQQPAAAAQPVAAGAQAAPVQQAPVQQAAPAAAQQSPGPRRAAAQAAPARPAQAEPVTAPNVLPSAFRGSRPTELRYSGPAEDGSATRARSGNGGARDGSRGEATVAGSAEPSRNRPCPCGSGRKYKQCHGSPTAARP